MTTTSKTLFLILPKDSRGENDLFELFSYRTIMVNGENISINFLPENSTLTKDYKKSLKARNKEQASKMSQKIDEGLKNSSRIIIKCFIEGDNKQLFKKIKDSCDNEDFTGIGRELLTILSSLEPPLKKFNIAGTLADFSKIVVAAHIGGMSKFLYMDIQNKINDSLPRQDITKKVKFVYFSGLDIPDYNEYIAKHKTLSNYSYDKLIEEKSDEQFKYFLVLLEDRAEGNEIEYFKPLLVKKCINDIIKHLLPAAVDCKGIVQLNSRKPDTSQYIKEAFDSLSFEDYLTNLWNINGIGSKLDRSINLLAPDKDNKLKAKIEALRKSAGYEDFASKFEEFSNEAASIKQSLR